MGSPNCLEVFEKQGAGRWHHMRFRVRDLAYPNAEAY
jgi:hypothetical protein